MSEDAEEQNAEAAEADEAEAAEADEPGAAEEKDAEAAALAREIAAYVRTFGRHVRSLRRARKLTQEQFAERSTLSVDTVRRLERGHFAASLVTLWKVGLGTRLPLSTLFAGFELGEEGDTEIEQLVTLLNERPHVPVSAVIALVAAWPEPDES